MLKTGMVIAERYEILGQIGTGGMADVYKAMDHKLNRQVAVKVLKQEFRDDKTFIKKFRSEAQAAAGLTHPNIVNVFDVGDDEGVYYIVMELIEGITLKEYISKKGKLSVKEATSIAIQVSMGLEAAHSHGIVHRDVKPQNIIISTDGKVKVTDFGIARAASSNTISSNVMGSVHYSSPEQVRGGYSDEKSDIYSLGITIYEMVTGRVPFDGDTTVAIAIKHLQEEMIPPSAYTPELPYSLEQIIYKCTQKSVDRRYAKMEDVIADLKHSLIDPQGDFVKLNSLDTEAKTLVISDKELGEIKETTKKSSREEALELERELRAEQDDEEAEKRREERREQKKKKKKRKSKSMILPILGMILGAALLIAAIYFIARESGLLDRFLNRGQEQQKEVAQEPQVTEEPEVTTVTVPDLVGMTEADGKNAANSLSLGVQLMGEEAGTQEKGRITRTIPAAGEQVQPNSTLQYYVSSGFVDVTVPDTTGMTGIDAQEILESMGGVVQVQKEYSDLDDDGFALVEPGYVIYTSPGAGTLVNAGDPVTIVVSRGRYFEYGAEMPNVVGMNRKDALTTLGKWTNIIEEEQQNSDYATGEVISQSIEAGEVVDPDEPVTIVVNQSSTAADTTAVAAAPVETADASSSEVWKCNQSLNTPQGYSGGAIRLELVQEVDGQLVATIVADGQNIEFPYQLDLSGAPGVESGTIYLYEQIDGQYQELGHYPINFTKVE